MTITPEIIDAMVESGCTVEQIAAVVKASLLKDNKALESKRLRDRERQRAYRKKANNKDVVSHDVTVTMRDSCDSEIKEKEKRTKKEKETPFPKEKPPKGVKKKKVSPLPSWIPQSDWEDFEELRKTKRKPMTERAKQMIFKRLEGFAAQGDPPDQVLQQSIESGWTNVYSLKNEGNHNATSQPKPTKFEQKRRALDEAEAILMAKHGIVNTSAENQAVEQPYRPELGCV